MYLILFDCDGTLVDSQHMIVQAMNLAYERMDLEPPGRGDILSVVGLSLPQAFRHLTNDGAASLVNGLADAYKNAFRELRADPDHHEPLFDGAEGAVRDLSARADVLLGIATGKSRRGVEELLTRHALKDAFVEASRHVAD